jgi:hypothetical protein
VWNVDDTMNHKTMSYKQPNYDSEEGEEEGGPELMLSLITYEQPVHLNQT